jgi:uncharacterized protein (DUF1778 family)
MAESERKTVTTSVRMTPEQERLIKQAAGLDNRSVNNFIISAAVRAAELLVRQRVDPTAQAPADPR